MDFAAFYFSYEIFRVSQAAYDSDGNSLFSFFSVRQMDFLDTVQSSYACKGYFFQFGSAVRIDDVSYHCFCNATRDTEDDSGTAGDTEWHVHGFRLYVFKLETRLDNEGSQLLSGDGQIDRRFTICLHFFSLHFEFLSSARHDSYVLHYLRIFLAFRIKSGFFLED